MTIHSPPQGFVWLPHFYFLEILVNRDRFEESEEGDMAKSLLARLRERILMKGSVYVDCRHADGWLGRCGADKSAAATAIKGLVWYGGWDSLDLSPVAFLPEVDPAGVLKGGDNLLDGAAPGLTVSTKCRPLVGVNVAGTEGLLEGVFKVFLCCPSVTVASGEFTIQGYIGQAMPPYSGDMPWPA